MRQLASYPRQNGVAVALRELGRLERTLSGGSMIPNYGARRGSNSTNANPVTAWPGRSSFTGSVRSSIAPTRPAVPVSVAKTHNKQGSGSRRLMRSRSLFNYRHERCDPNDTIPQVACWKKVATARSTRTATSSTLGRERVRSSKPSK
jgi:hypothetical protein